MIKNKEPLKFPVGLMVFTHGVADVMADNDDFAKFVTRSLRRHLKGDWGDVNTSDKLTNDEALKNGLRMLSVYNGDRLNRGRDATIWIITEADRSATTILFPDEYALSKEQT